MSLKKLRSSQLSVVSFFLLLSFSLGFFLNSRGKDLQSHLLGNERNTVNVFAEASSYVVNVSSQQYVRSGLSHYDTYAVPSGSGSGFVWDTKGHIVTNFHVIQKADKLFVSFSDGKNYPATVVGVEPRKDIAVLKVEKLPKAKLKEIRVANTDQLEVGQKAIAIGSPFGLDQSLTVGVISATEREIIGIGGVTIKGMVQTDATINPGNSGGPLLDSRGFLIGMNTMIFSSSGSSAGIGFAVPGNTIRRLVGQIIKFGRVVQVGFGIHTFSSQVSKRIGLEGVIVKEVFNQKSGLLGTTVDPYGNIVLGDVIIQVEDNIVLNYDDLYNSLESKKVGDVVTVEVIRSKKKKTLQITLIDLAAKP